MSTKSNESQADHSKKCINCNSYFPTSQEKCTECDLPLTPITNDLSQGTVIGEKYEIEGLIADGGMGKIYKASHKLMKRQVAIKMLHSGLVGQSATLSRFKKEAEASSSLDHTNIVTTFDFGLTPDGRPYLVMDFLEGTSFSDLLRKERVLEPARCLRLFIQLCAGFEHAHMKGIIHRDIKPSNILIIEDEKNNEVVKIFDFGIAKKVRSKKDLELEESTNSSINLTEAGTVFGSPLYMSPEQVRGVDVDYRSDIYSLCCLLYQALSGTPLYESDEAMDCMYLHVNQDPEPFSKRCPTAKISESLEAIVFKGLAKEPADRIQSMEEFRELLKKELTILESGNSSVANESVSKDESEKESIEGGKSTKRNETDSDAEEDSSAAATPEEKEGKDEGSTTVASSKPKGDYILLKFPKKLKPILVPIIVVLILVALSTFTDTRLFIPDSTPDGNVKNSVKKKKNTKSKGLDKKDSLTSENKTDQSIDLTSESAVKKSQSNLAPKSKDDKSSSSSKISDLLKDGKKAFDEKRFLVAQNRFVLANELAQRDGVDSIEYLDSVIGLGKTLLERKQYSSALPYLRWAYTMSSKKYGRNSNFAKATGKDLARAYESLGQTIKAKKLLDSF